MSFKRLLIVVILVTLCGGLFGSVVGALVGFAVPTSLHAIFGVDHHDAQPDMMRYDQSSESMRATMGINTARDGAGNTIYGAALGAAWGLILGAIIAIAIGLLDQLILVIRMWMEQQSLRHRPNKTGADS